ncbi:cyclase family protein [uncultured Aquimarina sp.]|uniref:cyclase family protein n=1 Tax=uncultured Aquimarina sp. TaxID=575652 RepID=UPI00261A732C|nr:cyclase family protein [uncultured Aquimarina sp.]
MITNIDYKSITYKVDLSHPLDISIPLRATNENVNAWYIPAPKIEPVTDGDWIGKVSEGASTNFNNIYFNPHGHGTHTECVGHITKEFYSINQTLKQFFFTAELVTINPEKRGNDFVITKNQIKTTLQSYPRALIIRTLPNMEEKRNKQYSHTNWPYLSEEAAIYIKERGIDHLLIDLPSVDKEKDDGKLLAHKAFWNHPEAPRLEATITEMIFVKNEILDGNYILNLQIASFENDASPSKPILYKILKS